MLSKITVSALRFDTLYLSVEATIILKRRLKEEISSD